MTIIPLNMSIHRNGKTGKKFYKSLRGEVLTKPILPKGWQTTTDYDNITAEQTPSFAIRMDLDTVVIDCDDLTSTEYIDDKLIPSQSGDDHYIVQSDKGFRHYYFSPSDYYKASPIYKTTRMALGKIDVLHGRALVYAPCANNTTKIILQGTLSNLTEIPDNIVNALINRLKVHTIAPDTDYTPLTSYLAPQVEQALALYGRSKSYLDLQNIMQLITPSNYRHLVQPDYHPDRIPYGDGINYLQALSSKVAQDPSISVELHIELMELIAMELWTAPLTKAEVQAFLSNLTSQVYNATGKPVFVYSPNATQQPLVSINGYSYMPIYRTLDDDYILAKPQGGVEVINGTSKFKKAMASKNYTILIDSKKISLETNIAMKKISEAMKTVQIKTLPYQPPGEFEETGSLYYNTYVPTKYISIVKGTYKQDLEYKGVGSHKTITAIIRNLMRDNLEQSEKSYDLFIEFLAHKLKTLEYSSLVFQMMGNRGIGKSKFMEILNILTHAKVAVKFTASNAQFNKDQETSMFLNEDEGLVTGQLVNNVKTMSGNQTMRIEAKGKDAYVIRNIGTYIITTNKTVPMAETVDDRRFVTLSGFRSQRLDIKDIDVKIALEMEAFALCLRSTKTTNHKAYIDANEWHDDIHYNNFEEKQDSTQHAPSKIANLLYRLNTIPGDEIHEILNDCFGTDYHYITTLKSPCVVYIPLNRHPSMIRKSDNCALTHDITREQLKAVELDQFILKDKNGAKTVYGQQYYRLKLSLSIAQYDDWKNATEDIKDISASYNNLDI